MAEKTSSTPHEDEIGRLKARINDLESELHRSKSSSDSKPGSRREETRRTVDSMRDVSQSKVDAVSRTVRGISLASIEGLRLFADSLSAFGDTVISRNTGNGNTSTRELGRRLPGDIAEGVAEFCDRIVDIPAQAAERYSKAHREGQRSDTAEDKSRRSESRPSSESGSSAKSI